MNANVRIAKAEVIKNLEILIAECDQVIGYLKTYRQKHPRDLGANDDLLSSLIIKKSCEAQIQLLTTTGNEVRNEKVCSVS